MREIKFRAWDKDKKEMVGVRAIHFDITAQIIACYCNLDQRGDEPIYNFDLMQFTGLKDKNGKEIYEGDILKSQIDIRATPNQLIVHWDTEYAGFFPFANLDSEYYEGDSEKENIEVIGNIYENPKLLKAS